MEKIITVLQVVAPIFTAIFLGVLARRREMMTLEEIRGLQQFVMKFGLPCVLFNSCLGADLGAEAVTTMVLVLPLLLGSSLWAFRARGGKYPYHNLPLLFSAQESGMLGIPLFMTLFGVEQAYRMGVLDMTQSLIAIPVIAILATDAGENPAPAAIVKQVVRSPLLLMSLLGLALNLTGAADWLNQMGVRGILTETTSFLAQPVSAVMLFSVGYNFSLGKGERGVIFRIAGLHFALFAIFCLVIQGGLFLVGAVDEQTRWAVLMYCTLPSSYLTASLGRSEEEYTVASGVCSVLTAASLLIFCGIAVAVA